MEKLNEKEYKYRTIILKNPDMEAGYIIFPYDIRKEFGKGRVKASALFDNIEYKGSIVNMGIKNKDGSIYYIIGITKQIREKINKSYGDEISVIIKERI